MSRSIACNEQHYYLLLLLPHHPLMIRRTSLTKSSRRRKNERRRKRQQYHLVADEMERVLLEHQLPPPLSRINSYTLFDVPLSSSKNRRPHAPSIIYTRSRNYYGSSSWIVVGLGFLFCALSVVQILCSFWAQTVLAIGWAVLLYRWLQNYGRRPLWVLRRMNIAPLRQGTLWGIWYGFGRGLYMYALEGWNYRLWYGVGTSNLSPLDTMPLLWAVLSGLSLGLQVGLIWKLFFGTAAKPSTFSLWIYRHLWRPLRLTYREAFKKKRRPAMECPQQENSCMICLEAFDERQQDPSYLPCLHGFHSQCLEHWLSVNSTCPICRVSIYKENENHVPIAVFQ